MLKTAFEPLSDEAFRDFVAAGDAIPVRQGTTLIVAKWRDGPGLGADEFLESLHAQGSKLEVRKFQSDVNIRVVRPARDLATPKGVSRVAKSHS